ncbi:MazG family protein [Solihabitans fulvus]|uniref:MazG family protein n=1 Tax=Solihabitans fulvus TaxID=1892852 RepID=A0A5B2X035_9PSEU|nr:MazG family protein [Solihabitans fulvus]KAA2255667.1 MazG family protein [Solihabitans fulvus]
MPFLIGASGVFASAELPRDVWTVLGAKDWLPPPDILVKMGTGIPVVLVTSDLAEPTSVALVAAGAPVLETPEPAGSRLLDAVAVMDRLRSPGGCPWDAEQTHDSLRQYLVEETFELLEAIEDGDRAAIREELGDVLLQVLFHARVAAEDGGDPFTVDDVAAELVAKLVGRHPHVFQGNDAGLNAASTEQRASSGVRDAASQAHRWEELKQIEKRRESSVDGVALGQPAVALAAKLTQRVGRAGFPVDLLPDGTDTGSTLFAVAALAKLAGEDPEAELRAVSRRFADAVRAAERAARDAALDPAKLTAQEWRQFYES